MPRISDERRAANRAAIVAAAARCFAREGFHQTSMPDVAAEAGVSTGAPYRYFSGKDDLIVEVSVLTFGAIFEPLDELIGRSGPLTLADLAAAAASVAASPVKGVSDEELLRCAVQSWAELLRSPGLRARAVDGVAGTLDRIAEAVGRGPGGLDPAVGARVVVALVHGFLLQRIAFGLTDVDGLVPGVRAALSG